MPIADDPFNLRRFVQAQTENYEDALAELRAGKKRTHWSWYVFPQIQGLGASAMSVRYAISNLEEAKAFLAHPVLGSRLRECVATMNSHSDRSAAAILGEIDARKFQSCITLFVHVSEPGSAFHRALAKYFSGLKDPATLVLLAQQSDPK
jgi:uncharacterized protein (DUF1810 family)